MIITYLRSSSYGAHSMCPMRYFLEYNLGWSQPSGKKAEKGTIVHKVLEIIGNIKLTEQNGKKQFTDDIIGRVRISNYSIEKMTEKVYNFYVSHSIHKWTPADLRECNKWIDKALTYEGGRFDPRNVTIEAVEKRFDIEILKPWAMYEYEIDEKKISGFLALKGTIDQIVRIDDETLEIVDWKTGRRWDWANDEVKTLEKLKKDPQLLLYFYCLRKLYPKVKTIIVTIFFINDGGAYTMMFTDKDLELTEKILRKKFEEIRETQRPAKNRSWKCSKFCHFGKTTFEGTSQLPIIERRRGQVTKVGQPMTMCEQTAYCLEHRDMKTVVENMSADGFNVDKYKAPGEVEEKPNE